MDMTPNLALPYIMPAQAQKHVTHNESIRALDALVQCAVIDRDQPAPPGAPDEGDRYIVPTGASGGWAAHGDALAVFQDGGWAYHVPRAGWHCWVIAEARLVVWNGVAWTAAGRIGATGGAFRYGFDGEVNFGDPGPGLFRLNNSTPALSTGIALAPDLAGGIDVSAMLAARFSSPATIKNRVVITAADLRLEFDGLGLTNNGNWLEAHVENGVIAGMLAPGMPCDIVFEWRN